MSIENQSFPTSVINRPAVRVIGLAVRTNMRDAPRDCKNLWHEQFAPRWHEVSSLRTGESYGVCWLVPDQDRSAPPHECRGEGPGEEQSEGQCRFDYWTALPVDENAPVPDGMRECYLPEGVYAECRVASLADLPAAYAYWYEKWLPAHTEYRCNMQAPCFELYPPEYQTSGRFSICFPLVAR